MCRKSCGMISGKSTLIAFFYLYNLLNLSMTITKVPLSLFFEKKREAQFAGGDIVSSYSRTSDWLSWKEKSLREKQKEGKREREMHPSNLIRITVIQEPHIGSEAGHQHPSRSTHLSHTAWVHCWFSAQHKLLKGFDDLVDADVWFLSPIIIRTLLSHRLTW